MDAHLCEEFLRAVYDAEKAGTSFDISRLSELIKGSGDPNITPIFRECKAKGWVMGSEQSPWLTAQGQKLIAETSSWSPV